MPSAARLKVSFCLGVAACILATGPAHPASAQLVISQLFGGSTSGAGGNPAAPNGDFIEIFNRSCVAVNLNGYSVQVASGGAGTSWSVVPLPNFQLDPGRYYCIRLTTTTIGTPFVADQTQSSLPSGGDLMLSGSGKAAIVAGDSALPIGACPTSPNLIDFVKYEGTATLCSEGLSFGVALGGTSAGRSVSRRPDANGDGQGDGCQDTNVNNNDFMSDTDPAVPRTNASPANVCPGAVIFGGCNLGDGSCVVTAGAAACSNLGGSYLGDCSACVAPQACCLPTTPVTCAVRSEIECMEEGGLYNPGQFTCPPSPACPPVGRCCVPDGSCNITFEALCIFPNIYGGNGTTCVGTPCQGRCCGDDGSCSVVGPADCVAPGVFAGLGTNCNQPEICQGRCCGLDGSCTLTGPSQCVAPSTFGGVGSNCNQPEVCQGRCCAPDGTCTLTGSTNCFAPNVFGGVGTTCQDLHIYGNPDPPTVTMPPAGAAPPSIITVPDNFIIQDVDVLVNVQHTWRDDVVLRLQAPDGTLVPLTGTTDGICGGEDNLNAIFDDEGNPIVCASPNLGNLAADPDRIFTTPIGGLSAFDGLPSIGQWTLLANDIVTADVGTVLDWQLILDSGDACKGSCCLPNTSCIRIGESLCLQQGGTFNGNGTQCSPSPCAPNGACCVGSTCSLQSSIDCGLNNGLFGGVGTDCKSPPCFVPCCRQDGTCALLTAQACAALPFAVAGSAGEACPPNPCAPVGACCFADGQCDAPRTQFSCTTGPGANGVRWTDGAGCVPNLCQGRCCQPDGTCTLEFPENCVFPGEYGGDGTNCLDPLACQGRCCSPDGSCNVTGPGNCLAPSVFSGIGTNCDDPFLCVGACCAFNGGECTLQGPGGCNAPDIYHGVGSNCNQVQCSGRCCQTDGSCTITSPGQCTGAFTIGLTCDPVEVFQFNDVNMIIVDNPVQTPASNIQIVETPTPLLITDLDVDINAIHTWPGDVQIFLEHLGTSVLIYDRPGVPASTFGCDTDHFNIILDDEGSGGPIETICNLTPPSAQSPPNYTPANALSAFDGMDAAGEWTITTIDFFTGDTGTLLSWSLHVGYNGQACPTGGCSCFGDLNGDGVVDGKDVKPFANCVASGGAGCPCGDMNHVGGATSADVAAFVTACLTGVCGP